MIGRMKDLLGLKANGEQPSRPADRLITSHDTLAAAPRDARDNDARIDAAVAAAVDTIALSAQPDAPSAPAAPIAPVAPAAPDPWLADAFDLLLAEEQGESPAALYAGTYGLSDADLDRIAERVVDRLARGQMADTISRIVTEVSERLVREEIARIRSAAASTSPAGDQP